jgi:hypothetical protein
MADCRTTEIKWNSFAVQSMDKRWYVLGNDILRFLHFKDNKRSGVDRTDETGK